MKHPEVTAETGERAIGDDQPIMLRDAARLMFPDGTVNEKSLRRLRDRGQLDCSRIRGRDYTTLAAMRTMLERTRVPPKSGHRVEVRRPEPASDGSSALEILLATAAELSAGPSAPRCKQARVPPPEPPRKPKVQKRKLTPRVPKVPISDP